MSNKKGEKMGKFTIRVQEDEILVVSEALTRTEKSETVKRLEEKYGGGESKVKLLATTAYTPILEENGD